MEKTGLGERLRARRQARKQRSADRARMRQENKVGDNARRALRTGSKGNGGSGGV
jgi:hypothetical protein